MLTYEIIVKYNTMNLFPPISWKQFTEPSEQEILVKLKDCSLRFNVPELILQEKSVVFVDAFENGKYSDPEVYAVDFSRFTIQ